MPNATLLLGSNLGDKNHYLACARRLITAAAGPIIQYSPLQQSRPWGYDSANFYLNQVVVVNTTLQPLPLLDTLLDIETALGRTRNPNTRYSDRTIDIDILYYDNITLDTPQLTIPHPRITERPFVLSLLHTLKTI